jgi:hypothetical protein
MFVQLWDQVISNPVGLAAGFDKDGEAIDGMSRRRFYVYPVYQQDTKVSSTLALAGLKLAASHRSHRYVVLDFLTSNLSTF